MLRRIFNRKKRKPRVTKDYIEVLSDTGAIVRIENPSLLPNGGLVLEGNTIHCSPIDGEGVSFTCPVEVYFEQFDKWMRLHGIKPNSREALQFCEDQGKMKGAGRISIVEK